MKPAPIDLSSCDAEPIHIPGAIQPHGALIAVDESERVVHLSANVGGLFAVSPEMALGRSLTDILGRDAAEAVARLLGGPDLATQNLRLEVRGRLFEGVLHRHGGVAVLELEPSHGPASPIGRALLDIVARLQRPKTVHELSIAAAHELRALTGFDRVMVYRFHSDDHGEVIAEDKAPAVESFLGHHFPASDIPQQARQLYVLNWIRVIPDARYTPVPLVSTAGLPPLDLTFASLRAVSPVHLEYMANMGVRASMSVSILRGDRLWGLLACHHHEPRQLAFHVRAACEVVARLVSLQLEALEEIHARAQRAVLRGAEARLVESMRSTPEGWAEGLLSRPDELLQLVHASGAAAYGENGIRTVGNAPSPADVSAIATWLSSGLGGIFATHHFQREYPSTEGLRSPASGLLGGLLAVRVRRGRRPPTSCGFVRK